MKNTNKNMTDFKPMLAKPAPTTIDYNQTLFLQPKLDGVRAYINKDGIFSRNNNKFLNAIHITTELQTFFRENPTVTLDGELYSHRFRDSFNTIISLVKKKSPTQADKFQSASYLQFHCYDAFKPSSPQADFIDRHLSITGWKGLYGWRSVQEVDTELVFNENQLKQITSKHLNQGYEGSILRNNKEYQQKRSHNLNKIKVWNDIEISISGFVEGNGKFKGGLGKFIGTDSDGRIVSAPWPSLTIEERKFHWANRDSYIGCPLTIQYFQRTESGAYRFPMAKSIRTYE
jgi:DNA ligase-1